LLAGAPRGGPEKTPPPPGGKARAAAEGKAARSVKTGKKPELAPVTPAVAAAAGTAAGKEVRKMNLHDVKELIKLIDETDIAEVSLESDGIKVAIRKGSGRAVEAQPAAPVSRAVAEPVEKTAPAPAAPAPAEKKENRPGLTPVVSPMVGTFYHSPSPGAAPFVKPGDHVHPGQTLCIIEAMKLMNEIEAEVAGVVVEVMVENGQPVEYGQTLFLIRES
ncbi:MAG: acetyl-CoA carboxylase biotin carboxyl carrier protein, partial [Peptococcaceae bacterium]|nr:acetyl-CoA carboxylase biotin carboxyl carrier protein [Peptococcaceae bacterium]